jgi:hypothetical protein
MATEPAEDPIPSNRPSSHRAGPTDISDPLFRHETKRAFVWISMAALFALTVFLAQPLLVIFGGMVFAAMVDGGARLLERVLPIRRGSRRRRRSFPPRSRASGCARSPGCRTTASRCATATSRAWRRRRWAASRK